jgi:PAS domain S-box-containing protein
VLSGQIVRYEEEVNFQGVGCRWVNAVYTPTFNAAGETDGWVAVVVDITARKQAEEEVRKLNTELETRVLERTVQLEAINANLQREIAERARAEELLRLQSLIVSNMSEGACLVRDCDQVIVYANPRFERMFGYAPGELNGKPVTVLNYSGNGKSAAQTAQRIIDELHEKGEAVYEVQNVKRDGTLFWCRAHTVRFDHPEFGIVYVAIHEDITEQKRAEKKFQNLLEFAPDAMVIANKNGEIMLANAQTEKLFGYSRQELLGRNVTMLMPVRFRERHRQRQANYLANPLTRPMGGGLELYGLRRDGREFPVEISLGPLETEEGIVTTAVIRDITERKQAQEALRRNEEHFRSLIENASDIISVVSAEATIRYESPSLERVLGYKPEDMMGKDAFSFIHPDDVPCLLDTFNEVIKTPGTTRFAEYRARHQDGSWRFLETVGKTLCDETGAMMIVVNSRDVTERKRAEEQIQILYFATRAINQAASFHEALAISLREICRLTGWEYGEAWVPSADGKRLECSPAWHGDTSRLSSFRKYSEELRFEANEGLPGRVWAAKQVEWVNDLVRQPVNIFRRAPMVLELGLKTAVGVPVLADGEVLAVLVFFSAEARAEDQHLVTLFSSVAVQLGVTLQRKQIEQELRSSHAQLRGLYASLQSVREEERTRVAREIHDELGQMLTALKIDLSWLAKRLPASQEPLLAKTDAMSKLVDMTIASVKRISAELRPGLLDNLGLAEAIEWQAGQFRERTGIECEVALAPESISLDRERSTILFRIVQEALTNITRHAQATTVRISLMKNTHKLLLKVRDNGKGITLEQIFDPHSFGLIGIRERVHPWGGKIKIKGLPGKGTVVLVSLPVNTLSPPYSCHQSAIIRNKGSRTFLET